MSVRHSIPNERVSSGDDKGKSSVPQEESTQAAWQHEDLVPVHAKSGGHEDITLHAESAWKSVLAAFSFPLCTALATMADSDLVSPHEEGSRSSKNPKRKNLPGETAPVLPDGGRRNGAFLGSQQQRNLAQGSSGDGRSGKHLSISLPKGLGQRVVVLVLWSKSGLRPLVKEWSSAYQPGALNGLC